MILRFRLLRKRARFVLISLAGVFAAWLFLGVWSDPPSQTGLPESVRDSVVYPQLLSTQFFSEMGVCLWMPSGTVYAATQREDILMARSAAAITRTTIDADRTPRRVIADDRATFSAIAVDPVRGEVILQDENLFQILVYNRLANTPPDAAMTEPKRWIGGIKTKVEFNCGLYVDPANGDIYSVPNDTVDTMVVFSRQAEGNVAPDRELSTPHGTYGIAADEEHQELYLTVQHRNSVVVYRKMAEGDEKPLRTIQGKATLLEDPHGVAVDTGRDLLFVANYGNARQPGVGGSGTFQPPSISVYPRTASGDVAPVAVIKGPNTQLNWPAGIAVDPEGGELFVANDAADSILVFRVTDQGNATPLRVLKGPRTRLKNPTGVTLDLENGELWVSNFGNHSATVFSLTADGDTPPLRTIRAAPQEKLALGIGNPGAVAYDPKRDELLVPN